MRTSPQYGLWACAAICLISFLYLGWVTYTKWMAGYFYLADVGNLHYAMWNTLQGRFMFSPMTESNHFAYHFTPWLVLISPITLLSQYPLPLVLSYTAALCLTPLPMYLMARQAGCQVGVALALGVWFVCNEFVGSVLLSWHFESFYILFAMLAISDFKAGPPWRLALWTACALSVKEDAGLWLTGFAVWAAWAYGAQTRRRAWIMAAACAAYTVLAGGMVYLAGKDLPAGEGLGHFVDRINGFGFTAAIPLALAAIILSGAGLSLLAGASLLLLLLPTAILLPDFEFTRGLRYYYSYPFLPFLALTVADGAGRISRKFPKNSDWVLVFALLPLLLFQLLRETRTDGYRRIPEEITPRMTHRLRIMAETIPTDAPLAIQFGMWGLVSTRWPAYRIDDKSVVPEDAWVVWDETRPWGMSSQGLRSLNNALEADIKAQRRIIVYQANGMVIAKPALRKQTVN